MSLDFQKIPRHIAIIMDGNGRWAKRRMLPRIVGHRRGVETVDMIVTACRDLGVRYLTLYAFSMENWARPQGEINALMKLLREFLRKNRKKMIENQIRFETIGDVSRLPKFVQDELRETKRATAHLSQMVLVLALSYSGRDEIVRAVNAILREKEKGDFRDPYILPEDFYRYLDTKEIPDPDLLIRTSGEYRISNFLLWQAAYTEFYFVDKPWPDFNRHDLMEAMAWYQKRERRFGMTSEQVQAL